MSILESTEPMIKGLEMGDYPGGSNLILPVPKNCSLRDPVSKKAGFEDGGRKVQEPRLPLRRVKEKILL